MYLTLMIYLLYELQWPESLGESPVNTCMGKLLIQELTPDLAVPMAIKGKYYF